MMKFIRHDRQYSTSIYIQYNAQEKVIEKTYAKNGKISLPRGAICYCPSVFCLSVTRADQPKTVEVRIMKFSPYGSPIPLVCEVSFIQKF